MTWNLENAQVELHGVLSFVPDIEYWLNVNNTYRVVFIQNQASWFVVTGKDFVVDAHNEGGIEGNGQPWWDYYTSHVRDDGDGRPLSLTLHEVERGVIRNFRIQSPPFWCNAVTNSRDVLYDGMTCNATNTNPEFYGQNIVPNTDGIDTYRSNNITLRNWDVTCGDDCLAIKGVTLSTQFNNAIALIQLIYLKNSTSIVAQGITCRGGNGVAIGSLGQYIQFNDVVQNVLLEDITIVRINSTIQPNMQYGVYFKSWTDTVNGAPPVGGGGGGGFVKDITARRVSVSEANTPVGLYQTNDGLPLVNWLNDMHFKDMYPYNQWRHRSDTPSFLRFSDLSFENWVGNASTDTREPVPNPNYISPAHISSPPVPSHLTLCPVVVNLNCSSNAPCSNITFSDFDIAPPSGEAPGFICINAESVSGLPGTTGSFNILHVASVSALKYLH
ncbi:hypothetical protein EW145_g825 [Phellinidium pouzarii]|uniref:galacturonan 1,4-alpha-galacturonidase n=1 Tax=Phellinidium pouzarii TaxID=167371 RepID=A0A4S4LHF3_9AGAM|nr:hypothetical protein EW145_g825 [Phellinidium pouzarii]